VIYSGLSLVLYLGNGCVMKKLIAIPFLICLLCSCGMSEKDRLELEQLRKAQQEQLALNAQKVREQQAQQEKDKLAQAAQARQTQENNIRLAQLEKERQAQAERMFQLQLERDRFARELIAKEDRKKGHDEREARSMTKIRNGLEYDVGTAVRKWSGTCPSNKITDIEGNVAVNNEGDDSKYFMVAVKFWIHCKHIISDDVSKQYIGKFYYNSAGDYKTSEWQLMKKVYE
jgi:hypothetical protein